MNEQERLQRIIDILADNAHEVCYVETKDENAIIDADMDGVQTVAREICNVFRHVSKDTRSKREQLLDAQFERVGIKPRVYHFTKEIYPFSVITIADDTWCKDDLRTILDTIFARNNLWIHGCRPATQMLQELKAVSVYGIAICDKSDVFSRRYGRMKAKGKLMQHLLKETNKVDTNRQP